MSTLEQIIPKTIMVKDKAAINLFSQIKKMKIRYP